MPVPRIRGKRKCRLRRVTVQLLKTRMVPATRQPPRPITRPVRVVSDPEAPIGETINCHRAVRFSRLTAARTGRAIRRPTSPRMAMMQVRRIRVRSQRAITRVPTMADTVHQPRAQRRHHIRRRSIANAGQHAPPSYQPITMFDSMALRACSRSEPVSCMYSRMACTLSPAAFERQSRATLHGSMF